MYQYASAFAKKHADVKTYLSAAIHNSISGHKWRDRSLSAPTVHHHLKAILEGLKGKRQALIDKAASTCITVTVSI